MHWFVSELQRQTKLTVEEPTRFLRIFRKCVSQRGRVGKYWSFIRVKRSVGERWVQDHKTGTQNRSYDQYADYLVHQASKLQFIDLSGYDVWFRECLADRLSRVQELQPGMTALCLAARVGTEVKAFQDAGCFAVGMDLNPGSNNRFVLPGDFHEIQFPAESVDIVYTNSIDHAFDVRRFCPR